VQHIGFKRPRRVQAVDEVPQEELEAARSLVQGEAEGLRLEAMISRSAAGLGEALDARAIAAAGDAVDAAYVYLPASHAAVRREEATPAQRAEVAKHAFSALSSTFSREQARLAKVEQRLEVLTKGYEVRCRNLGRAAADAASSLRNKEIEYAVTVRLAHDEAAALPTRVSDATERHEAAQRRERELQARYSDLVTQITELRGKLAAAGLPA
jgi:pre-mRNA-splicing factor CDC5/CEF1